MSPWVQTESGLPFDLLEPQAAAVSLEDIAGHLSKINRYAGGTVGNAGYSVAQHSVHVSTILETWGAPVEIQIEGLLHDAPEAYYGDVSSPVQRAMRALFREALAVALPPHPSLGPLPLASNVRDPFAELRSRVDPVVRGALGIPVEESPIVKRADLVALACERVSLMSPCPRDWTLPEYADSRWTSIVVVAPETARSRFLARHAALVSRRST